LPPVITETWLTQASSTIVARVAAGVLRHPTIDLISVWIENGRSAGGKIEVVPVHGLIA
jgi:hypothetical protein